MPYTPKPVDPTDIIRIEALELPEQKEVGEGIYDYRTGDTPKAPLFFDIIGLELKLKDVMPDRVDFIIDHLQNFKKVYVNIKTGEITS
jgi:hypothetical protein